MAATGNFPVGFSEAGFWAWGPKQWAGSAQGSIDLGPFFLPENPEGNLAAATYSVWILLQGGVELCVQQTSEPGLLPPITRINRNLSN